MKLVGDQEGIAALKELAQSSRDYLKFLMTEAQSASDRIAPFTGGDGTKWQLVLLLDSGDFEVRRAPTT